MINASVSHEMRAPLNSIIAFNVEKRFMLKELSTVLKSNEPTSDIKFKCLAIVDRLHLGRKCQESQSSVIKFLLQDLQDFAQLKAGKFQKNVRRFNIIDAVNNLLTIQSYEAE